MAVPKYSSKELTRHLRLMAAEADTLLDNGEVVTKAEALARVLWGKALGFKKVEQRAGAMVEVEHMPEAWAIQMVWERLEGKVPNAMADDGGKMSATDRVSELNKSRINKMANSATTPKSGPPKLVRKKESE